jgi:predicted TIM-barrel fold metal-dependent hydrolase
MRITDTHTHVWAPPSNEHPWVNTRVARDVAEYGAGMLYDAADLREDMDAVGVDRAVVVNFALTDWTDNAATIRAVEAHDDLLGVVTLDEFAADAPDRLREYMAVDGVLGLRLGAVCPHDRMWETYDPSVTWLCDLADEERFWAAVRETDAVVQILAHERQLDQVVETVERHPDVTFLLDHFALTDAETAPEDSPFSRLAALADYDVGVKLSAVTYCSNEPFPYPDMHDHVRWLLDTFGHEQLLWGSDYPNVSDAATYEEAMRWLDHVDGLSDADRAWLYDRSFERRVGP